MDRAAISSSKSGTKSVCASISAGKDRKLASKELPWSSSFSLISSKMGPSVSLTVFFFLDRDLSFLLSFGLNLSVELASRAVC